MYVRTGMSGYRGLGAAVSASPDTLAQFQNEQASITNYGFIGDIAAVAALFVLPGAWKLLALPIWYVSNAKSSGM